MARKHKENLRFGTRKKPAYSIDFYSLRWYTLVIKFNSKQL